MKAGLYWKYEESCNVGKSLQGESRLISRERETNNMTKKCVSVQTRGKRIFYVMNDQIYTCTQGYFSVIYVRTPKMQHKSISVTLSTWEW